MDIAGSQCLLKSHPSRRRCELIPESATPQVELVGSGYPAMALSGQLEPFG